MYFAYFLRQNSNFNFRLAALVINNFWDNTFLTSWPDSVSPILTLPILHCICICNVLIAWILIWFTQMKNKLVLNTNHGHLVSYATRTVECFLTTNGHKSWSFAKLVQATAQKMLFSNYISWPFGKVHNLHNLFSDQSSWTFTKNVYSWVENLSNRVLNWCNVNHMLRICTGDCIYACITLHYIAHAAGSLNKIGEQKSVPEIMV